LCTLGNLRQQVWHLILWGPSCLVQRVLEVLLHPGRDLLRHRQPGLGHRLNLRCPFLGKLES
jgi:hypothetical protein